MRRKYKRSKPPRKRLHGLKLGVFVSLSMVVLVFAVFLAAFDKTVLPVAVEAVDMRTRNRVNEAMQTAVKEVVEDMGVTSADFYQNNKEGVDGFSVDTMLINDVCAKVAVRVSDELSAVGKDKVAVPLGSLFGVSALANEGPTYTVTVMPIGNALVDYDTTFKSVGINQVNFQVWLNISTTVKIVNPLQRDEIDVSRKLSLVNTVITGEVPPTYFNMQKEGQ